MYWRERERERENIHVHDEIVASGGFGGPGTGTCLYFPGFKSLVIMPVYVVSHVSTKIFQTILGLTKNRWLHKLSGVRRRRR